MENHGFETNDTYELGDVIKANIQYFLRHAFNTGMPAQITGVDDLQSKGVINVTPINNNVYKDGIILEYPELFDVPILFQSGGRGLLSFPVQVNDTIWLSFSQRSLDEFLDGGGEAGVTGAGLPFTRFTPATRVLNHIKDAVAIPGIYTKDSHLNPNPTDVELKFAESHIRLQPDGTLFIKTKKDLKIEVEGNLTADVTGDTVLTGGGKLDLDITGNILIKSAANIDIQAPTIKIVGDVDTQGNITSTGTVKNNGVNIGSTHKHKILGGSSAPGPTDVAE